MLQVFISHSSRQYAPGLEVFQRDKQLTLAGRRDINARFAAMGLSSYRPAGCRQVERVPVRVTATTRNEAWSWKTLPGAVLSAAAGDWQAVRFGRSSSSIPDTEVRTGYHHIKGDTYERCGRNWARPAVADETVASTEGEDVAKDGEWVVRSGSAAERLVPAAAFEGLYEIVLAAGADA